MLVLTRKKLQRIRIADNIELVVLDIRHSRVRIGIECPRDVPVMRSELIETNSELAESEFVTGQR